MTETKKQPGVVQLTLVLFVICAATALLLGLVNYVTEDRILEIKAEKTAEALSEVLPADSYEELDYNGNPSVTALYSAGDAGWVVQVVTSGSQANIEMVVGIGADGAVTGVSIIEMAETSGLGTEAEDPDWRAQFVGADSELAVDKEGGTIDSLTGATVTSKAVVTGVNIALETVKEVAQ